MYIRLHKGYLKGQVLPIVLVMVVTTCVKKIISVKYCIYFIKRLGL